MSRSSKSPIKSKRKPTLSSADESFPVFLERLYAEAGFPDPFGGNRKTIENALRKTAQSVAVYLTQVGKHRVGGEPSSNFAEPIPLAPRAFSPLIEEVFARVVPTSMHLSHPRYMAHMDSGVATASIVADFVAAALNQNMLSNELAPAATALEQQVVRWFCHTAGLPASSGGTFVGGGTMANLSGLLAARDRALPQASRTGLFGAPKLRLFASVESHYSLRKAAAVLGLGSDAVIPIATDSAFRMDTVALLAKIREERAQGHLPFAVVGTAGSTSTGSIDPLAAIAQIAKQESLWFHVDAAHGGALLFSPREKNKLTGVEAADSITIDPHKWLWAGKSAGIFLLRDFASFRPASYQAPYIDREGAQLDLGRKTIDGSRRFDSLKVWMTFRHLGTQRIAKLIERNIDLTRFLAQQLQSSGRWEILHQPAMNVLCFASRAGNRKEDRIYRQILASGEAWIAITKLREQRALRTVILNPSTTQEDLLEIVRNLNVFQGVTSGSIARKRL